MSELVFLDCTLRDGGYYNSWNFSQPLIQQYLEAMSTAGINVIELGLRSLINGGFKGACAYTTDEFIASLNIPKKLKIAVMVNASELVGVNEQKNVLQKLFPNPASKSSVSIVRIASHIHEFSEALPAANWLKQKGYIVGFNLMQIADRTENEIKALAKEASSYPLDVLYFADSMGSMNPTQTLQIIEWLRSEWDGGVGVHTHDNMGLALSNTLCALSVGVTWIDSTVTGMGRGPGNARTEELAIELSERRKQTINIIPLMQLLKDYFKPMQQKYGWGTNPYYYLAGKYGIHPTYIQEMLSDSRYSEEDVLAVIEYLRCEGGKKFSLNTLDAARHFYQGDPKGTWSSEKVFKDQDILILGTGPSVIEHKAALERYIHKYKPIVLALNTQISISAELINYRVACHPIRLLADCSIHAALPQPLITPYSMLPKNIQDAFKDKQVLDFGLTVEKDTFKFHNDYCVLPTSMVVAYALAIITSGKASKVFLAGFDGYGADDPRSLEMNNVLKSYKKSPSYVDLYSLTNTKYDITILSLYGF
ncbi:hypothetical protein F885_03889 [Acinetobacter higginsii]|uniref:aldolase catalytic domain-containing protein n=1 Tax=Acinetobacter higginsii TaxID=70347 RepID=UPI0002CF3A1E|nr:aldolase catalytic domain-containing protein [Acinetobacter higginsii]ENX56506.1 hypothetical protein F885_03889 [Acinetobacter higginsii]